jgi:Protein of unknown function (DUF416)
MKINKEIYNSIEKLDIRQNILFSIFSIGRVILLYKRFDEMIKSLKLELLNDLQNGYKVLNDAYDFITKNENNWENINDSTKKEIQEHINLCNRCMPDDDEYGGYETTIAQYSASTVRHTLSYWMEKDKEFINYISDALIEIVGIIVFENYSDKYGDNISNENREKSVDIFCQNEVDTQKKTIKKILQGASIKDIQIEIIASKISSDFFLV